MDCLSADHHGSDRGSVGVPNVPVVHRAGGEVLRLPEEAVEAIKVRWPLWQKVVMSVTDFPAVADDGQYARAFVLALHLDHFGGGVFRV